MTSFLSRRAALIGSLSGAGLLLSGCDRLTQSQNVQRIFRSVEDWTRMNQRLLLAGNRMAREFKPSDISKEFKANGTLNPGGDDYMRHVDEGFVNWRLKIDGMVANPMALSLAEIRKLPSRTQITRHDCVEGWSAIGQWTGVPLGLVLKAAGVAAGAKYVVFYCADNLEGEPAKGGEQSPGQYYESIALVDAFHPQTLIAYAMNGQTLPVAHGAPLRIRIERQLGYKSAKYVQRIHITDRLSGIAGGRGGYWEDRGYEWYAGI
ncbi:molybdopterin-dependent oxidoreductase [Rhizomicrobium electricum]|uniref:Molybdopterin-binding protein n=1 Tax=Rhizomicrobium electricum TaxID=480070 RepID=A0ABP3QAQ0_9PROT|nr:molybdopterin-dependent oxidoreductase [Rhizomicrobium electricum]NIJ46671.1 DMSO/TMAO reductase YedYZ molybdopterin-dependent catalytic subunit [Rhizomicrobium electricum]